MRSILLAALSGLATAQFNSTASGTSFVGSISSQPTIPSLSTTSTRTSTSANAAITVALDGSGQYTAINAAVSAAQNSGIPTVTVLPGK